MSLELYKIFVKCFAEVDKRPKIMYRKTKDLYYEQGATNNRRWY